MAQWPVLGAAVLPKAGNSICLASGQRYVLGPGAGVYMVQLDSLGYLALQQRDPITGQWSGVAWASTANQHLVYSDGVNYAIQNITGVPQTVSSISNAGSGYTSAPLVTPSAGASIWQAIIGGSVTVTVTNGGTNYTYPPIVLFDAPALPGIQATGYATLTSGAVSAVTMQISGAGYVNPPNVTFVNDPREISPISPAITTGYGAAAQAVLGGAGTMTGLVLLDPGKSVGLTPTLAFSGGGGSSAAATVTAIVAAAAATAYIQQM